MADDVYKSSTITVAFDLCDCKQQLVATFGFKYNPMWAGRVVRLVDECVKGFGRNIAGRRQSAIHRGECKDDIKIDI